MSLVLRRTLSSVHTWGWNERSGRVPSRRQQPKLRMEQGQGWGFTGDGENLVGIQEANPVLQGFVAVLQCLHLDKGVLKQQDTKGLKITVCVYVWGKLQTIRYRLR